VHRYIAELQSHLRAEDPNRRPGAGVWSPLEYACHVRDVCRLFDQRLRLMLSEDDPTFAAWDQDTTATEDRYWEQEPAQVADQLDRASTAIAARFAAIKADEWLRPGCRSDGSRFTVDTFARYFLHDLAHHAWDVGRDMRTTGRPL
jgi:DinB superfamily